jgi:hypothetical protein
MVQGGVVKGTQVAPEPHQASGVFFLHGAMVVKLLKQLFIGALNPTVA